MSVNKALIFGSGKCGRGLCGQLCQRAGWDWYLADNDQALVRDLQQCQEKDVLRVEVLNENKDSVPLRPSGVYHVTDEALQDVARDVDLWFTAVFGENLETLAQDLQRFMQKRDPNSVLYILTCENRTHAAEALKQYCLSACTCESERDYINNQVRFIEGVVLKTCLNADTNAVIKAQDFYRLPCDADAWQGHIPNLPDLQPLPQFKDQLQRKIYTYNGINAVISFLGVQSGYHYLHEAALDPEIRQAAEAAADLCNDVLIKQFGFDAVEQQQWSDQALAKFSDPMIPDPLERNAAAPKRKLGRHDRLIGPAMMAADFGLDPAPLLPAIIAALHYQEKGQSIFQEYKGDIALCLQEVSALAPDHVLSKAIVLASDSEACRA